MAAVGANLATGTEIDDLPAGFDRSGQKMKDPAPVGTGWVR